MLHASKTVLYMFTELLSALSACKIHYKTRDKNEKSRIRVFIDLDFVSDQQNSHSNWTFQLFIPSYVKYYYLIQIH
jgi:hypothetical protein